MAHLPSDWDKIALQEYGKGASDEEVAYALRITMRKFKDLYSTDNLFMEVVDTGRDWAKAFWLKVGRDNLNDKSFNGPLWFNNMKNRWGWADKSEVSDKTASAQDAEQLRKNVSDLLNKVRGTKNGD
jgi:hypothetical protein